MYEFEDKELFLLMLLVRYTAFYSFNLFISYFFLCTYLKVNKNSKTDNHNNNNNNIALIVNANRQKNCGQKKIILRTKMTSEKSSEKKIHNIHRTQRKMI